MHANSEILIDVDNVSVKFGTQVILDTLSFCVHEAEFIGLIGPNGAGKTTLLRVLLGLLHPTQGAVTVQKKKIGYIPQQGARMDSQVPISVREVVGLGARSPHKEIDHFLDNVGMKEYASHRFDELSGGQQQRVLIAKAIAAKPRVLILDEPTTGIDESSQAAFYQTLEQLQSQKITIIMVSHDIDAVLATVDRVICLNHRILYDGVPEAFETGQYLPDFYSAKHRQLHHNHKAGRYV